MQPQTPQPLTELMHRFADYLPTLAAGLVVLFLGFTAGWVVKRTVVRLFVWLRLDRLAGRVGWRAAFGKGDVRAALYNLLGNVAMVVVVLFFVDDALKRRELETRFRVRETPDWRKHAADLESEMLKRGMFFEVIDWSEDQARLPFE